MKILVIDNNSLELGNLKNCLDGYDYKLIGFDKLNTKATEGYDRLILSGGHAFNVWRSDKSYKKEMNIIKSSKKPVLGICLGFQLICRTYGDVMHNLVKYEKGMIKVKKIQEDTIVKGLPKVFSVFENHRHSVRSVSKDLVPLANSKDGIEIVKHVKKPIWGVQFHPENPARGNAGAKIIKNFLTQSF